MVASAGWFVLVVLVAAALSMLWGGREAFSTFGLGFLTSTDWDPVQHKFGALVPIYGTLVTALIAMLIAVPVSFGIALFLTEVAPNWLRGPVAAGDRTAGRHSLDHLRHVGPVRVRSVHGRACHSLAQRRTWAIGR